MRGARHHARTALTDFLQNRTRVQYTEFVYNKRDANGNLKPQTQAKDISEFYTPLVAIPLYQTWENDSTWNSHLSILNLHDKLLNGKTLASLVDPGGTASDAEIHQNILSREIANIQTVKNADGSMQISNLFSMTLPQTHGLLKYDQINLSCDHTKLLGSVSKFFSPT